MQATASPVQSVSRRHRYESLDHWRGLACLLVIVYHSTIMHLSTTQNQSIGGIRAITERLLAATNTFNVGVAIFFVISGYCIAAAADSVRDKKFGVGKYFYRRFRRIYPPFWIVIVLSVVFFVLVDFWPHPGLLSTNPWLQPRPFWYSASQWFGNVTLTETWRHHLFGSPRAHFPGQSWTLCYEEQFYLMTGVLLATVPRAFFAGICGITVLTLMAVSFKQFLPFPIDGFFIDGSWLLFAAGVAVYYRINYTAGWRARFVDAVLLAAIPAVWFVDVPISGAAIGFAFAAALPFLRTYDSQIVASRLFRPLLRPGQMCYSLYLVHQIPVRAVTAGLIAIGLSGTWSTLFLAMPVSVGVALVLGWGFHIAVERRFLNAPRTTNVIATGPAGAIPVGALARAN